MANTRAVGAGAVHITDTTDPVPCVTMPRVASSNIRNPSKVSEPKAAMAPTNSGTDRVLRGIAKNRQFVVTTSNPVVNNEALPPETASAMELSEDSSVDIEQPAPRSPEDDRGRLVVAKLVDETDDRTQLPVAETVDSEQEQNVHEERCQRSARKMMRWGLLAPLIVLLVVLLVVFLVVLPSNDNDSVDPDPNPNPPNPNQTNAPTPMTTEDYVLSLLPDFTVEEIQKTNIKTPQSRAFDWILGHSNLLNFTDKRILRHYALACFYYSLDGDNWQRKEHWLNESVHKLLWHSDVYSNFNFTKT